MKNAMLVSLGVVCFLNNPLQAQPLTGLQLWLKADDLFGLNNGDKVATWLDSSGQANDATNPVVTVQPTYVTAALNGLPVVRFADGGNLANAGQYLDSMLALNANGAPFSAFVVMKSEVSATARDTVLQPLNDGTENNGRTVLYLANDATAQYRITSFASATNLNGVQAYRPGVWTLVALVQDPSANRISFWRDGVPDGSTNMGPFTTPNGQWRIGDNKPLNGGLQGDIAELLVYNVALSDTDRASVETYLQAKYALPPGSANPVVNLFRDNFNVSADSNDVNFENGAGRQSGSAGVLGYAENVGGANDLLSRIASGQLLLEANGANNFAAVSPAHNFNEGGNFTIEFDLDAGINDPGNTSGDWACVVFGYSTPGPIFVNGSDGMGILFRNNGALQVFDGGTDTLGGGTAPFGPFHVRIEVETVGFDGSSPATVRMWIDGAPVQLGAGSPEYVKSSGLRGNYLTLGGSAFGGANWIHAFDNLIIYAEPCIRPSVNVLNSYPGQANQIVTVSIPSTLNANAAVEVVVTSDNPSVAEPGGAVGGSLTLTFPAGGPTSQLFTVAAYQRGTATLTLSTTSGACIGGNLVVNVGASLLANPSFENNYNPAWPHYGPVDGWGTIPGGNSGVNEADGPFHDNGVIPDRARVALYQGNGGISQMVTGLDPNGEYWLQFRYNRRQGGAMQLRTVFDGVELDDIPAIPVVGGFSPYHYRHLVFTPTNGGGLLEFRTTATGDATALLDAVTIVPRGTNQVQMWNPSFEASGDVPSPGLVGTNSISGWIATGEVGINRIGEDFADTGVNPDQDHVAVIKGPSSLSQTLSNLVVGQPYQVIYSYNAGSLGFPGFRVTLGGDVLLDDAPVSIAPNAPYPRVTNEWVATSASAELKFEQYDPDANSVILVDDVQVIGQSLPPCDTKLSTTSFAMFDGQPLGSNVVVVTLPLYLVITQAVDIIIISQDPSTAVPTGATDGVLTLHLDAGLTNYVSFSVTALRSGTTTFLITNNVGCPGATLTVMNRTSLVFNPSFEDNSTESWPGYTEITGWSAIGGSGLNPITVDHPNGRSPFADNGFIPDRGQIVFIQGGPNSISQVIQGLDTNKQYWLQLHLNARNCCGDFPSASASFNGVELASAPSVPAVGGVNPYYFINVPFTPNSPTGALQIISGPTASGGDRTLLVDAVTLVQRDAGQVVVQNPSFEASGTVPSPGYVSPALMAGWSGAGNYGVNIAGSGLFADNGRNPDQDNVAFLQGETSSISQVISNLVAGSTYALSYAYNARSNNTPRLQVTVDGVLVHDEFVPPVGGINPYHTTNIVFQAIDTFAIITFTQAAAGDQTVLLDDVRVLVGSLPQVPLSIRRDVLGSVRLSWPKSAGANWVLQSAPELPPSWVDTGLPVGEEGDEYVVYDSAGNAQQFYQLIQR